MKNKSIIMKILIVGSILLVLLLLVVIFSLIKFIMPKDEEKVEKKEITKTYTLEDVDNLSFNFKKANSKFEVSEDDELVIIQNYKDEKFHLNYKLKENTIYLEEDSYIINPQKKYYTIYIPKKYKGKINITNGFGEVEEEGITNDIYINNNAGSITLKSSRNIKLKDVSGEVTLENIEGNVIAESSTGNIKVNNLTGIIHVESITGDITVNNLNIIGDSNFENIAGDIIIDMADNALCKLNASNDRGKTTIEENVCADRLAINIINIKNVTGIIKIY